MHRLSFFQGVHRWHYSNFFKFLTPPFLWQPIYTIKTPKILIFDIPLPVKVTSLMENPKLWCMNWAISIAKQFFLPYFLNISQDIYTLYEETFSSTWILNITMSWLLNLHKFLLLLLLSLKYSLRTRKLSQIPSRQLFPP